MDYKTVIAPRLNTESDIRLFPSLVSYTILDSTSQAAYSGKDRWEGTYPMPRSILYAMDLKYQNYTASNPSAGLLCHYANNMHPPLDAIAK